MRTSTRMWALSLGVLSVLSTLSVTANGQVSTPNEPKAIPATQQNGRQDEAAGRQPQPGQPVQGQVQGQEGQIIAQPGQRVVANRQIGSENSDQTIATAISICNQAEVDCAKLAASHAHHAKVREFAEMLARDHAKMVEQLRSYEGQNGQPQISQTPAGQNPAEQQPRINGQVNQTSQVGQQAAPGGVNFLTIERQVAQLNLESARQAWSDKDKNRGECDMAYVGTQLVLHKQMLNKLKVLEQYASPGLQKIIESGIETTKAHKEKAKELVEMLAKEERSNKNDK